MARRRRRKKSEAEATGKKQTKQQDVTAEAEATGKKQTKQQDVTAEAEAIEEEAQAEAEATVIVEEPETDETEEDNSDVDALTKELAEAKDKYIRTLAELDNLRKRKTKDVDEARRYGRIGTLEEIMPVMDQFQMAVAAIETASDMETIKMGMKMIQTTFDRCFENLGVVHIPTIGEEFDPNLHEAITMEPSDEVEVDHIIREWKAGYKLGDYLLRAPSVVVSSGPAVDESEEEDADDNIEDEGDETAETEAEAEVEQDAVN